MAAVTCSGSLTIAAATLAGALVSGKVMVGGLVSPAVTLAGIADVPDPIIWDNDDEPWGEADFVYSEDKPVLLVGNEFFQADEGTRFADADVAVVLSRTGLTIFGRDRSGAWKIDPTMIKEITAVFPIFRAVEGTIIKISVGAQGTPDEPISWEGPYDFVCGTDFFKDFTVSGRYLAVRFESLGQAPWELLSYDLDIVRVGGR